MKYTVTELEQSSGFLIRGSIDLEHFVSVRKLFLG